MRRLAICTLPLLAACYTYAPIETANVHPGAGVRARVSGSAVDRLAPLLGTSNPRLVSGRLVDTRADTLILEVPTVMQALVGSSVETLHQRVSIPRSELVELEMRRLDRFRTAAVVGGAAIVIAAVVIGALGDDPGYGGPPGPGGGNDVRAPLLRVRF
jgi:hypothetical protein